jgi:chromosome partitioning protein
VVALINQKGGVGKTTTTVNLAAGLAQLGKRVLIIDLDPQAHATLSLGVDPSTAPRTVYDLLLDWDDDPSPHAPPTNVMEVRPNLSLIPAETDLAAAEGELASQEHRHRRLARALSALGNARFDFVFIDCPPSLGLLTLNALAAASEVVIPMQAHFLALQGVSKLLETVRLVNQKLNPSLRVSGVVLCSHDANVSHAQEVVGDLDAFFEAARGQAVPWCDAKVFRPFVRRNIKLAECPSFGKTIFEYAPGAAGALDYLALAQALVDIAPPARVSRQPRKQEVATKPAPDTATRAPIVAAPSAVAPTPAVVVRDGVAPITR